MKYASKFKQRGIFGLLAPVLASAGGAGAVGSAVAGAVGSLIDSEMADDRASSAQRHANEFSVQQARENREFQERMSSTSYQRAMADMSAAGLNPMLAYSQGGASTPGGATAQFSPVRASMLASSAAQQSSGAAAKQAETSASQVEANIRQIDETVIKTKQEVENLKTVNQQNTALLDNIRQEYQNLVKQGLNLTEVGNQLRKMVDKMDQEIKLIGNQTVTEAFRELLVKAQTADTNAAALLKGNDLKAAELLENSGAVGKALMPIATILKMILGR